LGLFLYFHIFIDMKICYKCTEEKPFCEFGKNKTKKDGLQSYCKVCQKIFSENKKYESKTTTVEYRQNYYNNNKQILLAKQKIYKDKNREIIKNYQNDYRKKRRLEDPTFRLAEIIRSNVARIFNYIGSKKETKSYSIVEYTPIELKQHIESLFLDGMTWDNYGDVWEIDHTIPVIWFANNINKFSDKNHLCKEANALSNLKPMFFDINRRKSSNYEG